jgi:hypothetical protein
MRWIPVLSADMWLNKLKNLSQREIIFTESCVIPFTMRNVCKSKPQPGRIVKCLDSSSCWAKRKILILGLVSGDTRSDNASLSFSSCSMKSVSVIYLFYNTDALVSQHTPKHINVFLSSSRAELYRWIYTKGVCACTKLWLSESRAKSITNSITQMTIVICADDWLFISALRVINVGEARVKEDRDI